MNKNRKRLAAIIVTVLLAAFLAACSSGASSTIGPDGASYDLKGLDKGTFLEDGLWAGYFIPNGEGSLRLIYDNQVFSDIILYYSLENGKLILDYPFGMVKMQ